MPCVCVCVCVSRHSPVVRLRNNDTFFQSLRSLASPRFLARLELVKASKNGHITARKAEVAHLEGRPRDLGVPRESVEVVATRLRDGESIVANEVQELHSHLANISRDIGRLTGVTVNANMYVFPPLVRPIPQSMSGGAAVCGHTPCQSCAAVLH